MSFAAIIGIAGNATLEKARENGFETDSIEFTLKRVIEAIKKNYNTVSSTFILSHMSNRRCNSAGLVQIQNGMDLSTY